MDNQHTLFDKEELSKLVSYQKAVKFLDDKLKFGIKEGTERIEALLQELGNPHTAYETILVTGTNGKTSTARMISTILGSQRVSVGLYTSPHLHSYCERMQVDGQVIPEEQFIELLEEIKPAIEKVDAASDDPLTNFEIITALGFYYFAKSEVKCVVLEVGMGARFDATCLTNPKVSVITNIDLDHTQILGETIEQIAAEKSFVIKEGSSVVIGDLQLSARNIIEKKCQKESASLYALNEHFCLRSLEVLMDFTQSIRVDGVYGRYWDFTIPTLGKHQALNATLAFVAAELFKEKRLIAHYIKYPLNHTIFNGRLEIIRARPITIIDGAHNPAGARALAETIKKQISYIRLILVLAIFEDKDYKAMVDELVPLADSVIFSQNSNKRSLGADELAKCAKGDFKVIKPLADAIKEAQNIAAPNDLICITGSLDTAADAREILGTLRV